MLNKRRNKFGELTTQQLVILIILIVSFAVILIFIFLLNPKSLTEKEICHNSIVLKSQVSIASGPIDCKTSYVCISGGGECENFNPTITVDVDLNKDDAKDQIMKVIVDEVADCWWMFGEGKIEYVDNIAFEDIYCSICSIFSFDEKVVDKFSSSPVDYSTLYNSLSQPKDNTQTYLKYLYKTDKFEDIEDKFFLEDYFSNKIKFDKDKQYFVLTAAYEINKAKDFVTSLTPEFIYEYGFGGGGDYIAPPIVLEKTKSNYDKVGCTQFITKA